MRNDQKRNWRALLVDDLPDITVSVCQVLGV